MYKEAVKANSKKSEKNICFGSLKTQNSCTRTTKCMCETQTDESWEY